MCSRLKNLVTDVVVVALFALTLIDFDIISVDAPHDAHEND